MNEIEFVDGMIVKAPNPKAPDWVKASISIKPQELINWLMQKKDQEWVNLDVRSAKSGKWYVAVNTFKPKSRDEAKEETRSVMPAPTGGKFDDMPDDLPF